jgi:hypothetical protein
MAASFGEMETDLHFAFPLGQGGSGFLELGQLPMPGKRKSSALEAAGVGIRDDIDDEGFPRIGRGAGHEIPHSIRKLYWAHSGQDMPDFFFCP